MVITPSNQQRFDDRGGNGVKFGDTGATGNNSSLINTGTISVTETVLYPMRIMCK